ncbi:MAG TPA: PAAR domain-containing protein, partial [Stellaceae bacterium]|nr:PAAR domain-containing protein [Stellaceae bacterium]
MGQPAARVGDQVLQQIPHCHAPIHPPALAPTPAPHPGLPLAIIPPGAVTVTIGGQPAARVGDMTEPCMLPSCVPAGPGVIAKGSATV